ncbi:MAG: HEAT repeat domain-containing protein [Planctomycetota bacterium]
MRKLYFPIAILILAAAIFFLSRQDESAVRKPPASAAQTAHANETATLGEIPEPGISAQRGNASETSLPADAKTLLSLLKKAIADGDWQRSKTLCEEISKAPGVFALLRGILLENESMNEKDAELRWRAAWILGLMENSEAIPVFEEALANEKAESVRETIVFSIGKIKHESGAPILERLFLDESSSDAIKNSAAKYLAETAAGQDALSAILRNSETTKKQKISLIQGLSAAADKTRAAAILEEILTADSDNALRSAAVKSIGKLAVEDSIPLLSATLKDDSDFRVRVACAQALGNFKNDPNAVQTLADSLRFDTDARVRANAAGSLGTLGAKEKLSDLKHALENDADRVVRVRVVNAIAKAGGDEAIEILKTAAEKDASPHVREAAKKALSELEKE